MSPWLDVALKFGELGLLALVVLKTSADQVRAFRAVEHVLYRIEGALGIRRETDRTRKED